MKNNNATRIILGDNGRVLSKMSGPLNILAMNTPENAVWVDVEHPPASLDDYWDGERFVSIGEAPSPHHTFDYSTKRWSDTRDLDEIKAQKWVEIKTERDNLEFGGFEFEGNIYDSDQVSQGRIMGAAVAGVDQTWTLANNTTVDLIGEELKELYAELQRHVASVHERGRIARNKIDSAMTAQDIEAVTL